MHTFLSMHPFSLTPEMAELAVTSFLIGILVAALLGAGFLTLHFGMLSERSKDREVRRSRRFDHDSRHNSRPVSRNDSSHGHRASV